MQASHLFVKTLQIYPGSLLVVGKQNFCSLPWHTYTDHLALSQHLHKASLSKVSCFTTGLVPALYFRVVVPDLVYAYLCSFDYDFVGIFVKIF